MRVHTPKTDGRSYLVSMARTRERLLNDEQTREAWVDYKSTGNMAVRERLILNYTPLVKYVAGKVGVTLPAHIDNEDLASYGMFGLIDAIEKFDLEREIKFETYAINRIRGQIIDELRSIDWIPRSVRSQVRDIDRAAQALEIQLQRPATDREIAEHLGLTLEEFQKNSGQQNFINMVPLDALMDARENDGQYTMGDRIVDNRTQNPVFSYEAEEFKDLLAQAVSRLPERERIVLVLYYYERLTLAEIGKALGVTESRVCQMHTRAMKDVRARLWVQ